MKYLDLKSLLTNEISAISVALKTIEEFFTKCAAV
jgi:hypothetical protein